MRQKPQYSASNSWNANNNGQLNNNNKRNGNRVCAVSDYQVYCKFVENMFAAYYVCRKNKRSSYSEIEYEKDGVRNTLELADEVFHYRYRISPSICFIVHTPTKREVFAADFRDRCLHHWIALRIENIFEKILPPCIYANRKGKGTSAAIRGAYDAIKECSENYTKDAWIYKFDLQGFFMSIDKRLLWSELKPVLEREYTEWDKDWLMYVIEMTIFNRPQDNCIKVCPDDEWNGLAANKSLFNQDEWHGLPIGDLLSQMLVGFFLTPFVHFMWSLGFKHISNYVDDFVVVSPSKELILESIPKIREYLKTRGITLHPRKCYIQHYTKGVTFLGGIIKPYRMYCGRRTVRNAFAKPLPKNLERARQMMNSYFGYFRMFRTRRLRKKLADRCFGKYHGKIYFSRDYLKLVIKKSKKKKNK